MAKGRHQPKQDQVNRRITKKVILYLILSHTKNEEGLSLCIDIARLTR